MTKVQPFITYAEQYQLEQSKNKKFDPEEAKRYAKSIKVEIYENDFEGIHKALSSFATIERGGAWTDGTCYCYVKTRRKSLLDFVESYLSELAQEKALFKGTAPEGRKNIECTVTKLGSLCPHDKERRTFFAQLNSGATVHGTLPTRIATAKVGDVITINAEFRHVRRDITHSFLRRVKHAAITSRA